MSQKNTHRPRKSERIAKISLIGFRVAAGGRIGAFSNFFFLQFLFIFLRHILLAIFEHVIQIKFENNVVLPERKWIHSLVWSDCRTTADFFPILKQHQRRQLLTDRTRADIIPLGFFRVATNVHFSEFKIRQSVFVTERREDGRHLLTQRRPVGIKFYQPRNVFVAFDFIVEIRPSKIHHPLWSRKRRFREHDHLNDAHSAENNSVRRIGPIEHKNTGQLRE